VRELRFHLLAQQARVTYWPAPGRRLILLTVFRKARSAEIAEVARALQAQKTCEAEHGQAHDEGCPLAEQGLQDLELLEAEHHRLAAHGVPYLEPGGQLRRARRRPRAHSHRQGHLRSLTASAVKMLWTAK
jgi:hypothetical protein